MKKKIAQKPKISIIIPTKNEEKVLEACLESLQQQKTDTPYEILIVDAASKDKTVAIAKRYGARIIVESRPGRNIAHQVGVEQSKGSILCFTEADCVVTPTWIETYVQAFEQFPDADAFVGRYTYYRSTALLTLASKIFMPVADTMFRIIHGHYAFRASNFAIKATALARVGGFNLQAREFDDVELSTRVAKKGTIKYLPAQMVQTGDRRVRGRLGRYIQEVSKNYFTSIILKRTTSAQVFADIR